MSDNTQRSRLVPHSNPSQTVEAEYMICMPDHVLLAHARQKKGYTLKDVADAANINIRHYQKFESGERDFRSTSFSLGLRVCHILDLDPYRFM